MEALNGTQTPDGELLTMSYARPLRKKFDFNSNDKTNLDLNKIEPSVIQSVEGEVA
jgi:hypothetical protein